MPQFYAYILASRAGVLYIGMTNDLGRRVWEHKHKRVGGFTAKYNVNRLVWYETFPDSLSAIAAEKKLKGWTRTKKIALIESVNPQWRDLSEDWDLAPAPEAAPALALAPALPSSANSHPERSEGSRAGGTRTCATRDPSEYLRMTNCANR